MDILTYSLSKRYADKLTEAPFKNLLANSDFSQGTTGWTPRYATISVSDKIMSVVGSGGISGKPRVTTPFTFEGNHKYYVSARVQAQDSECEEIRVRVDSLSTTGFIANIKNPEQGMWYDIGGTFENDNAQSGLRIEGLWESAEAAIGKTYKIEHVLVINLTTDLGEGNEPNTHQMNEFIKNMTTKGFKGVFNVKDTCRSLLGRFFIVEKSVPVSSSLPLRPMISLRFDDGHDTDYLTVYPALQSRGLKGSFYPIGRHIIEGTEGRVNGEQIKEMAHAGHEIGSHCYNHVRLDDQTDEDAVFQLVESKKILEETTGLPVHTLAVPFHSYSKRIDRLAHGVYDFVNVRPQGNNPTYTPYGVVRNSTTTRMSNFNLATLQSMIDEAIEKKVWLVMHTHKVLDVPFGEEGDGHMALSIFEGMLDYINSLRPDDVDVVTIAEGARRVRAHLDPTLTYIDAYYDLES